MKDQNTIHEDESPDAKWNRGLDLYIESVHKADHHYGDEHPVTRMYFIR